MKLIGIFTAVIICGIVWGGFVILLSKAILKEKEKFND